MSSDDTKREYSKLDPVAGEAECTLTVEQAEQRSEWVQSEFLPHLEGVDEREDGYAFAFAGTEEALEAVMTAVLLESRCCSHADFRIEVPAEYEEIRLTVTGPEGSKELAERGFFERFDDAPAPP